ncbi:hypothetical protein [uncultured Lamprocystis sp.]|jgi:hypothetical protein|nr:hypothetical protein [uncultured Lamprocystis sp.]
MCNSAGIYAGSLLGRGELQRDGQEYHQCRWPEEQPGRSSRNENKRKKGLAGLGLSIATKQSGKQCVVHPEINGIAGLEKMLMCGASL